MEFSIIVGILGIAWTIYGVWSSSQLKKHLLADRDMISDKILDIRGVFDKYRQVLLNDRKNQNNQKLDQVHVRIEDIENTLESLDRFKIQLERLK